MPFTEHPFVSVMSMIGGSLVSASSTYPTPEITLPVPLPETTVNVAIEHPETVMLYIPPSQLENARVGVQDCNEVISVSVL